VTPGYQFASDNTAGICPEAWAALESANQGYAPSYGEDPWTREACSLLRALFEAPDAEVFFVLNGTASNSLSLSQLVRSHHGILCHETAHVRSDECGAPAFFSGGAGLLGVSGTHARIEVDALRAALVAGRDLHAPKPRALTLSQSTEWGTCYRPAQIAALAAVAHEHGLLVHMDGARFANALAGQAAVSASQLTWRCGVDVLSLGGTKNGLSTTEAALFFDPALAREFEYRVKQGGQLASKMRFQTCQWQAVLSNGAWLRHAAHANAMAQELAQSLSASGARITQPVEANAVFLDLEPARAAALQAAGWHFHLMPGAGWRLMCSWATRPSEIEAFVRDFRRP
jgi:threonine aldolase